MRKEIQQENFNEREKRLEKVGGYHTKESKVLKVSGFYKYLVLLNSNTTDTATFKWTRSLDTSKPAVTQRSTLFDTWGGFR